MAIRGAMDTVQELRGCDRSDPNRFVCIRGQRRLEIKRLPFGGDQDGRIDQRACEERGSRPCLRAARRTSDA
jgi:hypothetical protein